MKKSPFLIKNSFLKNSVGFVIKDNLSKSILKENKESQSNFNFD